MSRNEDGFAYVSDNSKFSFKLNIFLIVGRMIKKEAVPDGIKTQIWSLDLNTSV